MNKEKDDYDEIERNIMSNKEVLSAIEAVNDLNKWEFMRTYEPPINKGYMFDDNTDVLEITSKIVEYYPNHSGISLALTLRTLQFLSKYGQKTLNYLRRRNYLLFLENIKQKNVKILNDDVLKEIGKFI